MRKRIKSQTGYEIQVYTNGRKRRRNTMIGEIFEWKYLNGYYLDFSVFWE